MDSFVCSDYFSITCGTWIALLNGSVGALVSAVIGGLVALLVVRLTNAQQRRAANRTVEIAAIADFISAMEEAWDVVLRRSAVESFDRGKHTRLMRAPAIRLEMSSKAAQAVSEVIMFWPYELTDLMDFLHRTQDPKGPVATKVFLDVRDAVAVVGTYLTLYTDPLMKKTALKKLVGVNGQIRTSVKLVDNLPPTERTVGAQIRRAKFRKQQGAIPRTRRI
ncbi:hypothetical protein [Pseudarthrobacter sp. LT1]|uniref:hypothetical protein n=1 Tax=Pseudarthrobacter sp. LT1 TaxID=3111450 RepID=UPI002D76D428|nr:hypothetical protein [Pseudarthrobacter sp. LT1]WRT14680.1 hypothetical protein VIK36_04075 [Pseudarthrobacter sp. LT1]